MGGYSYTKVWRKRNPEKRKAQRKRHYDRTRKNGAARSMKHWTEDDLRLMLRMSPHFSDQELSRCFGRSVQSIQSARYRWRKRLG